MLINNMLDQMEYQILKEKYMRYHRRVGAKNALDAFDLPEEYMPADECKGKIKNGVSGTYYLYGLRFRESITVVKE